MTVHMNERALSTVIAALTLYHSKMETGIPARVNDIASRTGAPLDPEAVQALILSLDASC